jgi:hypothetical protein
MYNQLCQLFINIYFVVSFYMNLGSSVSVVPDYRLEDRRQGSIPDRGKEVFLYSLCPDH